MALLKTVRAKLTLLVGLSSVAALATLPLLEWLMTGELVDVVDDRMPEAVKGFDLELEDNVHDLESATRSLTESAHLQNAVATHDAGSTQRQLEVFHTAYPDTGFVVFNADGTTLVQSGLAGPAAPPSTFRSADAPAGQEIRTIADHGCTATPSSAPAYVLARPIPSGGLVLSCLPLDAAYLAKSSEKLGVELAIADGQGSSANLTAGFPRNLLASGKTGGEAVADGKTWALMRFAPAPVAGLRNPVSVVAALDVTRIQNAVRRNLVISAGVIVFAALFAILLGARLASRMSGALSRLSVAHKRLGRSEYAHVTGVHTQDEFEELATGFNTMVDGLRERDKLRATLGKYMTQSVMEHLLSGKVELGGKSIVVTILFADIRSFTTISEAMTPQEVVSLLNEYFTEMVTIVMAEEGVVDKYIGDAIMAVFGAPVPKADDPVRAVRAAVRMREALASLNERLVARGASPLKTGIGVHTGEVVAGNIGSEARMEYTVIGDAVNLASRLETATKELGAPIVISEDTHALIGDQFDTRALREISVKGRAKPVTVYEVRGFRPQKGIPTSTNS
jgi:adenylate cyclase